ncbi:MAG: arylesterase [Acidobacteria bacterium]|nr:arylesterase [Acidobacteriota bacterium]
MPVIHRKFKLPFCYVFVLALCLSGCQASKPAAEQPAKSAPATISTESDDRPVIVAFGDSLTAGYNLSEAENYTTLLQQKLDAKGYRYRVVNAGVSGDTSAGGVRRIDWALTDNAKLLILELGGNDALRGQPVSEMKKNLAQIIETAQKRGVRVLLAGMEAPRNLGAEYTTAFRQAYHDLAKEYQVAFIPFVLEGVGGRPELNQPDGIHPNAEGEKIFADNVWRALEPLLAQK